MTKLRRLWLLTAVASIAVLASGYFLLVSPQNTKAASIREEVDTQQQINRQLKSQIDMLNKQKKDLPAQQAKLAKFAGLIPTNPALPRLIRSLTDSADNAGVELTLIAPELPKWTKGVNTQTRVEQPGRLTAPNGHVLATIPLKLRVYGTFSEVTQFFTELEQMNRALMVVQMHVEQAEVVRKLPFGVEVKDQNPDMVVADIGANVLMTKKAAAAPVPSAAPTTDATS